MARGKQPFVVDLKKWVTAHVAVVAANDDEAKELAYQACYEDAEDIEWDEEGIDIESLAEVA
jgi:dihydroneopterin aldolase